MVSLDDTCLFLQMKFSQKFHEILEILKIWFQTIHFLEIVFVGA